MERSWALLLLSTLGSIDSATAQESISDPSLIFSLQGTVYDKHLLTPLEGAIVNVVGTDGSSFRLRTDEQGAFKVEQGETKCYIQHETTYSILVEKEGYLVLKDQLSNHTSTESTVFVKEYFLQLAQPTTCRLLPNIYFAQNSFELTRSAIDTLDMLLTVLEENPTLVIEVIGFHDSSEAKKIASKRSQSTRDHLISRGVHPGRLISTVEDQSSYFVQEQLIMDERDAVNRELLRSRNRAVWYKVIRTDWKP